MNVGVSEQGAIEVDAEFRTSEPSIFALGDVTGGIELTPVALAEGMAFARRNFGEPGAAVDYDFIPYCSVLSADRLVPLASPKKRRAPDLGTSACSNPASDP